MKNSFKFVLLIIAIVVSLPVYAEQDPEAAARQAKIDADKARVKLHEIERKQERTISVDDIDSPQVRIQNREANVAREEIAEAEARESEAEAELQE